MVFGNLLQKFRIVVKTLARRRNGLVFVFGVSLFACALEAVHGGAATGPVLKNALLNHHIDQFFR